VIEKRVHIDTVVAEQTPDGERNEITEFTKSDGERIGEVAWTPDLGLLVIFDGGKTVALHWNAIVDAAARAAGYGD